MGKDKQIPTSLKKFSALDTKTSSKDPDTYVGSVTNCEDLDYVETD